MIKIIEKEVKIKEYDVEPKVTTLYYVDRYNKDVIKVENCVFQNAMLASLDASDDNYYWLEYKNKELYIYVGVDITTGKVNDDSFTFFDYEQAVKIHKERRIEFLKDSIDGLKEYQKELKRLKDKIDGLKEYQKELEELENDK
jgi:hypothetical protein